MRLHDFHELCGKTVVNGRCPTDESGRILLSWPCSGVEFGGYFDGEVRVYFDLENGMECNLHVMLDRDVNKQKVIKLKGGEADYFVAAKLEGLHHIIEISKADSAAVSTVWLRGISYDGDIDAKAPEKTMLIECIGDSISAGEALIGQDGLDSDAFYSYEAVLARKLNARLTVVAASGFGISMGGANESAAIPRIYDETAYFAGAHEKWDFANNEPDVVILNLGTSDYAYATNGKKDKLFADCTAFLDRIRGNYPNAKIIWIYGMMLRMFADDFKRLAAGRWDKNFVFRLMEENREGIGGHPIYTAHAAYAEILEKMISR